MPPYLTYRSRFDPYLPFVWFHLTRGFRYSVVKSQTAYELNNCLILLHLQVWLSVGEGCSYSKRLFYSPGPTPIDSLFFVRDVNYGPDAVKVMNDILVDCNRQSLPGYDEKYNLYPGGTPGFRPVLLSENLGEKIASGRVMLKPLAVEMTEDTVRFCDGTEVKPDTIYAATGYDIHFPYLPKGLIAGK